MPVATLAAIAALILFCAAGVAAIVVRNHPMAAGGTILAAVAPLAFILIRGRLRPVADEPHPVGISAISGLGCVIAMVAVYRQGDSEQWLLGLALAALVVWMLWQRKVWRQR